VKVTKEEVRGAQLDAQAEGGLGGEDGARTAT